MLTVYIGFGRVQVYQAELAEYEGLNLIHETFMSSWTNFCIYFQVFVLIAVIINLLVFSSMLFAQKVYLDHNQVYS